MRSTIYGRSSTHSALRTIARVEGRSIAEVVARLAAERMARRRRLVASTTGSGDE